MRYAFFVGLICVAAVAVAVFFGSYAYFKSQEIEKAQARLSLFENTVIAELQRFRHLPFVLSLDPVVAATLTGASPDVLNTRLARFSQSAGIDSIYLMTGNGDTISASNAKEPTSFVGQNYKFRPYFKDALKGELGEFYGIGATTGIPGYFYAMSVRSNGPESAGVIAIKVDLSPLQDSWTDSGARIILSNSDGIVLLASSPDWRYRAMRPLSSDQRNRITASRQFGAEPLQPLNWKPDEAAQTARISGERFLYVSARNLPNSWRLHYFATDAQAMTRAWLVSTGFLLVSGLIFFAFQTRRVRRVGRALLRSEHEEAQLRLVNERLAIEIEDRRAAEQTLRKAQADLDRAGRLAALGQLASSVTHELGQPIAAMRNHLAAEEISQGPTALGDKLQGLVVRMESITQQLKFFSRKGRDKFEVLDVRNILDTAQELLVPSIQGTAADFSFERPALPLYVRGNVLRLEQVMTNLLRNAIDAVEASDTRRIKVMLDQDDHNVCIHIQDTGHGLGNMSIEDLREPFATTRESGKGMGLGLTISAGIISDHGGTLKARNLEPVGAQFTVTLPRHESEAE